MGVSPPLFLLLAEMPAQASRKATAMIKQTSNSFSIKTSGGADPLFDWLVACTRVMVVCVVLAVELDALVVLEVELDELVAVEIASGTWYKVRLMLCSIGR